MKGQKNNLMAKKHGEFLKDKNLNPKETINAIIASQKKNSRHETILSLLNKKEGLGIKDFADQISGCSEKTIQRELLAMVESGIIRKEGDRRWSKYYLA